MSSRISAEIADQSAPALQSPRLDRKAKPVLIETLRRLWLCRLGVVLAALAWTLAWYWGAASSMAGIWWRSDTFAHGLVVYPIACWLIWRKRSELEPIECKLSFLGLAGVAAGALAWLLGELGEVDAARHFGLVLLVGCTVWATLGTELAKAIAFPLLFTLLAVPIGEFMLPVLIEQTADFTVGALRATGIPVYREGNNFVVPTGHWSVVEACSGLRYLIASVTLGLLYAYLSYRSPLRRLVFVTASVVVPILANWLRAYMIVMIGHLSGMTLAVGVDHLLYGWIFFGIVMLLLFWCGGFWREDVADESRLSLKPMPVVRSANASSVVVGGLLSALVAVAAPLYAKYLEAQSSVERIAIPAPIPDPSSAWTLAPADAELRPLYQGAQAVVETAYAQKGRTVGLYMAYYAHERNGEELIAHGHGITDPAGKRWTRLSDRVVPAAAGRSESIRSHIRSVSTELIVRHWYWVGGEWVRRPEEVKLRQAIGRLFGRGDAAAVVMVFSRLSEGSSGETDRLLDAFISDMTPVIEASLRHASAAANSSSVSVPR